jgi:hypothetical protein
MGNALGCGEGSAIVCGMASNDATRDVEQFDAYRAALREAVNADGSDAPRRPARKVRLLHRRGTSMTSKRRAA